jgi:4-oxalomesaconate tautomerase
MHTPQRAIPCAFMRAGTSRGPFFLAQDLPQDTATRDAVLLAVMGSPDPRQIDGLGGADTLTSKVAIVSRSTLPGVDIDFLFAQVAVDQPLVDVSPNCGNMLAGVGPFAIERGLVEVSGEQTPVVIHMVNSGNIATAQVQTPGGRVAYDGDAAISGVPGTSAPINIAFRDTAGSVCGSLLPTGSTRDVFDGIETTCIDNGMPVVVMLASAFGKTGYETPKELDADPVFKQRLEKVRLLAGEKMGLGDVGKKVVPKMTLISPAVNGGHVSTRTFIPHRCHSTIGVLGAVSVASACVLPGSVAEDLMDAPDTGDFTFSVEHPGGEFTVALNTATLDGQTQFLSSGLLRTARMLFEGSVFVPHKTWR